MYFRTFVSLVTAIVAPVAALSGQATTTRYGGGTGGSCGCGMDGAWTWQLGMSAGVYTAAGSQALFDTASTGTSWCGGGCGSCYQLTSTGTSATGGDGAPGQSITVMLTNYCPTDGNAQWCPPSGGTNAYGFGYHFDIMAENIIFGDNVIVNFQQVACPGSANSMWPSCQCSWMMTPSTVSQSPAPATNQQEQQGQQQPDGSAAQTTAAYAAQPTDTNAYNQEVVYGQDWSGNSVPVVVPPS